MGTISADAVHRESMKDPAYRRAWEESDLPMQISFALCGARDRAGLSQAEIAGRIGVSEAAVAGWERGGGELPDLNQLCGYATATGSRLMIDMVDGAGAD